MPNSSELLPLRKISNVVLFFYYSRAFTAEPTNCLSDPIQKPFQYYKKLSLEFLQCNFFVYLSCNLLCKVDTGAGFMLRQLNLHCPIS